ncbi:hypothetical protein [uncultured Rhodoferax sp.]|uniref:hypothetical protein n=1 Tax=uncultured Rhodoferax sp. TaxID=223188 RepID=UPI0025E3507D|nr:hypothetical protein [uncultured Rhodoferax sp.]
MSSAVQALIDGRDRSARHRAGSRYRAWCACCAPDADGDQAAPHRRNRAKPVLAWRTRLEAQLAETDAGVASPD